MAKKFENKAVILFDGVCNLCNGYVQFIIKRDPKGQFQFAPLQSQIAEELIQRHQLPNKIDSVILIDNDKAYTFSDAPLKILYKLGGFWSLTYPFILVPKFIRDRVYKWIAKNRYQWFGQKNSCMIPTPELKQRFLG